MRRHLPWILAAAAAAIIAGPPAEAYYHYIHFLSRTGPFNPIYEKFAGNTVTFFVNDTGPASYGPTDSFGSVLGQVKQAIAAWNSVPDSGLRVQFGGLETEGQTSGTPGGDVVFQDLAPGILGMGGTNVPVKPTLVNGANGPFIAIARSIVILTNNTSIEPGPSYLEGFFTTAVHEFGHALGLQHTWTAAAMSQAIMRNTSNARPLDADDMAAFQVLYGNADWATNYGSISGKVTINGQPVALASVVAISPTGPAISTLTNPDGTYTIGGLPANSYMVYVHPLPPDAIPTSGEGLLPPADMNGQPVPAYNGVFGTVFYPATRDSTQATSFTVAAGTALKDINFAVQPKTSLPVYNVLTESFFDPVKQAYTYSIPSIGVQPAYVDLTGQYMTIVAWQRDAVTTPLPQSVSILGGLSSVTCTNIQPTYCRTYQNGLAIYFTTPKSATSGPRHLVFNYAGDIYVLPSGINIVQKAPPTATGVIPNPDGTVTISGTSLGPDTRVFLDGLPATVVSNGQGSATVVPPSGNSGQTATVTLFNSDGQNSMFIQQQNPQTYPYNTADAPQVNISPTSLAAGTAAIADITGANVNFTSGQVTIGFGTSDVTVRRLWVLTPTHVVADIVVAPGATPGVSEISVISGFRVASQPFGFQIRPADPTAPAILAAVNADPTKAQIGPAAGGIVTIYGLNLQQAPAVPHLSLNNVPVQTQYVSANQINFYIPLGMSAGPATLKLNNGSASALPVIVALDSTPPAINGLTDANNNALDSTYVASPGDVIDVLVTGLDPTAIGTAGRVHVLVSGVDMPVLQVAAMPDGSSQIQFVMAQSFGGEQVPLVVAVDGAASAPLALTAR